MVKIEEITHFNLPIEALFLERYMRSLIVKKNGELKHMIENSAAAP